MTITNNIHEEPIKAFALTNQEHQTSLSVVIVEEEEKISSPDPLSKTEKEMLNHLEGMIQKNLTAFFQVGEALANIKKGKLYRSEHSSFEAYCLTKWGFGRHRAIQYIQSAETSEKMLTSGQQISDINERQLRPLAGLEAEVCAQALVKARELAGGRKLTSKHIEQAVEELTESADGAEAATVDPLEIAPSPTQILPCAKTPTITTEIINDAIKDLGEMLNQFDCSQHIHNAFGQLKTIIRMYLDQNPPAAQASKEEQC